MLLLAVTLQTMKEYAWHSDRLAVLLPDCVMLLFAEVLVDWVGVSDLSTFVDRVVQLRGERVSPARERDLDRTRAPLELVLRTVSSYDEIVRVITMRYVRSTYDRGHLSRICLCRVTLRASVTFEWRNARMRSNNVLFRVFFFRKGETCVHHAFQRAAIYRLQGLYGESGLRYGADAPGNRLLGPVGLGRAPNGFHTSSTGRRHGSRFVYNADAVRETRQSDIALFGLSHSGGSSHTEQFDHPRQSVRHYVVARAKRERQHGREIYVGIVAESHQQRRHEEPEPRHGHPLQQRRQFEQRLFERRVSRIGGDAEIREASV